MFALTFLGDILVGVGAYVAAIYTWPWLREKINGADMEIKLLEARIARIQDAFKK